MLKTRLTRRTTEKSFSIYVIVKLNVSLYYLNREKNRNISEILFRINIVSFFFGKQIIHHYYYHCYLHYFIIINSASETINLYFKIYRVFRVIDMSAQRKKEKSFSIYIIVKLNKGLQRTTSICITAGKNINTSEVFFHIIIISFSSVIGA